MDPHRRVAFAIQHAVADELVEAITVQINTQQLARHETPILDRQRLAHEASLAVIAKEHAVVHRLGHQAVVVPVHHAQTGVDQARACVDDVLPQLAVGVRAIEVKADGVGDVAERR